MLPQECLVPFNAQRSSHARLAYTNQDFDTNHNWLDRFAYSIPSELTTPDQFLPEHKEFLAERYGGHAIVTHGGGVSCGLDGGFSVKGMGCIRIQII